MIGNTFRNVLIATGLAVVTAVPTMGMASRYTGTKPESFAVNDMTVDVPVMPTSTVNHSKSKKHTKITAATTAKKHSSKKHKRTKAHSATVLAKHYHKKATTVAKTKKQPA